jgi:hypothetical protein
MHTIYGYIDIFPPHKVHAGKKCLVFSDFHKHSSFCMLSTRIIDYIITPLSGGDALPERRAMILDFDSWAHGHPNHYGILMIDTDLEKGCVVRVEATVPDLGGV